MAGAGRLCRLHGREQGGHPALAETAAGVVAPVLGAFVSWVLATARERGWRRLYFVSRDGQILVRMARELAGGLGLDCRYLHGSRQAWFLAALDGFDLESAADWLFVSGHSLAPPMVAQVGIVPGDLAPAPGATASAGSVLDQTGRRGEDPGDALRALMGSEAFAVLVSRRRPPRPAARPWPISPRKGCLPAIPWSLWTSAGPSRRTKGPADLPGALRGPGSRCTACISGSRPPTRPGPSMAPSTPTFVEQPRHFDPTQRLKRHLPQRQLHRAGLYRRRPRQAMGYRHTPEGSPACLGQPPGNGGWPWSSLTQETAGAYAALLAEHAPLGLAP
jgi:hypothetical protein